MKILIAEDDSISAEFMQRMMEKFGQCLIVGNGIALIAEFARAVDEENPYDLIMLDFEMPKMNGVDALVVIRQIEKTMHPVKKDKIKIIIMSAHSDKDNVISCIKAGCDKYMVKPFDKAKVNSTLETLGIKPLK